MTALLEMKQKIKGFYGQYEIYILPVLKFILALVYFVWINMNMGYMKELDNIFIVLVLALICSILPSSAMVFVGALLMIGHAYALGIEAAGFLLVLILFLMILFLRFSAGSNVVLVLTPLSFAFDIPVLLPIGSGLLGSAVSALPAGCGVILYYFVRLLRSQSQILLSTETESMQKLTILVDGMMTNWTMWITVIAFVVVVLAVNLIRTRAFDYAWRIAIVAGGVIYVVIMLGGSIYFGVPVAAVSLIVFTLLAVLVGLILEFFVFGGDYSRTERLEYEDDEYYYYVKAVPKASVATSERNIKKINAEPLREEKKQEEQVVSYQKPLFQGEAKPTRQRSRKTDTVPLIKKVEVEDIDFEKKLEESLKDL